MSLANDEIRRYARQLALSEVGMAGQEQLRAARILCVGAGGLGSPAALYLAAAGVGRLGVVEFDTVDPSNLQRQILHREADVGRAKGLSAREALQALNPNVAIDLHATRLTSENALEIIRPYDVILDGTDNFPTRFLVNDACVLLGKPNVYGAVLRFEGQASLFAPLRGGPCYRCLYPEPPPAGSVPNCAEGGVLGVVPGVIGTLQATEAIKWVLGVGESLLGRLLLFDALRATFREMKVRRDPGCPVCGDRPTITQLIDYEASCSGDAVQRVAEPGPDEVDVGALCRALAEAERGVQVLDVREPYETQPGMIPGALAYPLSTLSSRSAELDPDQSYYLYCKSGVRSLEALRILRRRGFKSLKSVRGGILAWAQNNHPAPPKA